MYVMSNTTFSNKKDKREDFFENVVPMKLTESKHLKMYGESWGLITDYYLESVKINCDKAGEASTTGTLKIADSSGQAVCVIRGPTVGLLFGLSVEEWLQVEKLCNRQQLFYRYFKEGLSKNFCYEQKLFYNFCLCNQKKNVLIAVYRRGVNRRNKDRDHAFLEILELKKCNSRLLDLYLNHLKNETSEQ